MEILIILMTIQVILSLVNFVLLLLSNKGLLNLLEYIDKIVERLDETDSDYRRIGERLDLIDGEYKQALKSQGLKDLN